MAAGIRLRSRDVLSAGTLVGGQPAPVFRRKRCAGTRTVACLGTVHLRVRGSRLSARIPRRPRNQRPPTPTAGTGREHVTGIRNRVAVPDYGGIACTVVQYVPCRFAASACLGISRKHADRAVGRADRTRRRLISLISSGCRRRLHAHRGPCAGKIVRDVQIHRRHDE